MSAKKRKLECIENEYTPKLSTAHDRKQFHTALSQLCTFLFSGSVSFTKPLSLILFAYLDVNEGDPNRLWRFWCRQCLVNSASWAGMCYGCGSEGEQTKRKALYKEFVMTDEAFEAFRRTWPVLRGLETDLRLRAMFDVCLQRNMFLTPKQLETVLHYVAPDYRTMQTTKFTPSNTERVVATLCLFIECESMANPQMCMDGADGCAVHAAASRTGQEHQSLTCSQLKTLLIAGLAVRDRYMAARVIADQHNTYPPNPLF